LFAVIGAKLSEGLNFSDDLARGVVVVGLPFANLGSPELQERLKYVKRLEEKDCAKKQQGQKDAAAELYENMCMNAVNQSIGMWWFCLRGSLITFVGRAIRHKGDWASLVFLDARYSTPSITKKLPGWIGESLLITDNFGQAVKELGNFFRTRR
jgi:chromosome transmission fidelity protein 1